MTMYSLNLMRIALELATEDPVYEDIATKFFGHFLYVAGALSRLGSDPIADPESDAPDLPSFDFWDEQDQFYYDVLHLPNGRVERNSRSPTSRANRSPACSAATRTGADRSGFRSTS